MFFDYKGKNLHWQKVNLKQTTHDLIHKLKRDFFYEGPFFLYHKDILHQRITNFINIFPNSLIYFAVKSLSNIAILNELRQYKKVGLDVVSKGEIYRGLKAGFSPEKMVFAGVGKTTDEIRLALCKKIKSIHVESLSELKKIIEIAQEEKKTIEIALRLNPNIDSKTHQYVMTGTEETKFGIDTREIIEAIRQVTSQEKKYVCLTGLHIHLGSQIMNFKPYENALVFLYDFLKRNKELEIHTLSLGGGFGIDYKSILSGEEVHEFPLQQLSEVLAERNKSHYQISFEPGRFISAPVGLLICQVLYIKPKSGYEIVITNAGMSELIRPTLYHSEHRLLNITIDTSKKTKYDIVGPICETGDFFAKGIYLNDLKENDYLAVTQAGAYASSMSSNYNSRPLIPEVFVDNQGNLEIIRKPQNKDDLFSNEILN